MNPEICQLHRLRWVEACNHAKDIISSPYEARQSISPLLATAGWRERYSAAIVVTAFHLDEKIPQLVEDFRATPEFHVCQAYASMLLERLGAKSVPHLKTMKAACSTDDRGLAIAKRIDDAIHNLSLA